jgi:hypothetical protein
MAKETNDFLDFLQENDPLGLLKVKPKKTPRANRSVLLNNFEEIVNFFEEKNREPQNSATDVKEFQLYCRLKHIRTKPELVQQLKEFDLHGLLKEEGVQDIPCSFKQLTGIGAGNIYKGRYNPHREDDGTHMYLNSLDRSKLTVSISGYRNSEIEQHFNEKTELEKIYGKTITLRQLLIRWKTDNRKFMNIDLENDYDMVKRVYDSEDILAKSKSEELSK